MDHAPNSDTFQKHYLNRHVCVDLWAIHRNGQPQQALVEKASSHGHSRSQRRPAKLTTAQSEALKLDPMILSLKKQLSAVPERTPEHRALALRLKAAKARLGRDTIQTIRKEWTAKQAVDDIDRQIEGLGFAPATDQEVRPMSGKHQRLVDALLAPLIGTDIAAQFQRRSEAIAAIIAYCCVEEPLNTKVLDARVPPPPPELEQIESAADKLRLSVFVTAPGQRLRRCFICVAKALGLAPDDPDVKSLCRPHSTAFSMTRHFRNVHLSHMEDNVPVICPICPGTHLKNKMHLQNHADTVHGIKTDFSTI